MTPFRHLLAASDLSTSSLHAVDRGFQIARVTGAGYTVLHAMGLDALSGLRELLAGRTAALSENITQEAHETLTRMVSDPVRNLGVSAQVVLEDGPAAVVVPQQADALDADLVLLGAHGKGFLQRFMLGSTASRLLRTSRRPLLLVKEPCRAPYRRMLVAVDFSPGVERAVQTARALAPGASLILLHVFEVPFEGKLHYAGVNEEVIHQYRFEARELATRRLHQLAASVGLAKGEYVARVLHGDATRQILHEEEQADCDLIVMGKHGTHVTEELLLGSVTKRVIAESRSDLLVVVDRQAPVEPVAAA